MEVSSGPKHLPLLAIGRYAWLQEEVVAVFIVDAALEHTCAEFASQADNGQITAAERDLLIDGAVLLAAKIEELTQDARTALPPGWVDSVREPASAVRAGHPG